PIRLGGMAVSSGRSGGRRLAKMGARTLSRGLFLASAATTGFAYDDPGLLEAQGLSHYMHWKHYLPDCRPRDPSRPSEFDASRSAGCTSGPRRVKSLWGLLEDCWWLLGGLFWGLLGLRWGLFGVS
ncbi:unnamed protein product, partial [Prorocentrum cordatum]